MEAQVVVTRRNCHFDKKDLDFEIDYSFGTDGYMIGTFKDKNILDKNTAFYHTYNLETQASADKVIEYECKTSFYTRQFITRSGSSCPSPNEAPSYINQINQGEKVEFCEARTAEREVIARDQWGTATAVACSWLCRSAVTYDEPWKCASFFYMMDDVDRNGPAVCNNKCYNATSDNHKLAECCKCINGTQGQYLHHETPGKVSMVDPDNNSYQQYTCSVSGYQYAKASNGGTTTASGYQAEIINGHINEGGSAGYYMLSPYGWDSGNQHFWTPYTSFADANDPGTGGWYSKYSLINSENGQKYLGDAQTSLFTTGDAEVRKPVCVYDLLWNWTGSDCSTANCSSSCCSIDLSQDSNNCDYPSFWMKIPDGHGGKILMENLEIMSQDSYKTIFRNRIKGLKASGPSTLGETLYDVWRYLGGMYSLHDPGLVSNGETVISSKPYKSPFSTTDGGPMCFTNEAVIISGGNPQFDANYELKDYGVSCPDFDPDFSTPSDTVKPCVKDSPKVSISQHSPYIEGNEWERTSLLNVAKFVNKNTFWAKEECRNAGMTMSNDNAGGIKADCLDSSMTGANKPVIDRVHAIAVGEWGLSALYHSLSNTGNKYLNESLIKQVAESTEKDGEKGRYYTLTTTNSNGTSGGGSFDNLTDLFASFVNNARPTDVVVGRPHWTSSLVQPFDVEEKYRGPEAYVAGAVPVDGTVSRFWFGNLKKYEIRKEQEGSCPIYDDNEADCGEWKKQTFDANDCFASDDNGTGFSGADSYSVTQFEKLMVGGAAFRLAKKLGTSCSGLPCYQQESSPRKLYTDMNGEMELLKNVDGDDLESKFKRFDNSFTGDKIEQIFDYMAGYDSFNPTLADRKKVRYSGGETFKVDNPFDVDFNHSESKKLTLRPLLLGAIIHSKPVAVYYEDNSNTRIYAGANDGMLHAFDSTGDEVYAYIPSLAYKSISNFANTNSSIFFNATVDGPITMFHIDQSHDGIINSGEKAFLIFGYRRGAKGYTVIDISDPDAPKFVQNLNDENSGHEGGLSFGKAVIFRKCSGSCSYANDLDYYLAVPGGYDTCHDPTALTNVISNNTPLCSQNELLGNKFTIYKFDKDNNRFDTANSIEFSPTSSRLGDFEKSWLVTSFTSNPFVINTSGKAAVNTEFVYFTDLSGTVFRVDVRSNTPSDWTAKVVYTGRNGGSGNTIKNIDWKSINRSYVATNFFPPLERYNPSKDENGLIPIPVITGNAANPKFKKQEGIHVFYDSKDSDNDPLYTTNFLINSSGDSHSPTNGMIENKRGWQVDFGKTSGEKGITEPLIVYDIYGTKDSATSHSYTIAWNTYTPMEATACKTFGTSSNYERFINDGAQAFKNLAMTSTNGEWNIAGSDGSCVKADNLSLATGVGIVATDNGYDLTFGAGADIFRKEHLTVKMNATYMIKWYELY